jgi:hypothetical protein
MYDVYFILSIYEATPKFDPSQAPDLCLRVAGVSLTGRFLFQWVTNKPGQYHSFGLWEVIHICVYIYTIIYIYKICIYIYIYKIYIYIIL